MTKPKNKEKAPSAVNKYLLQMTRKGVFLGICLFFFISAWMFILGILVGRGTAPIQFDIEALQNELIDLKESIIRQVQEKQSADSDFVDKKRELDFYEALKGTQTDEKLKLKPLEEITAPLSPKKVTTQTHETKKKAAVSLKKQTMAVKSSAQSGAYTVQVASTKNSKAADQVIQKLQKRGYQAYKTKAEIAGKGTWYRVRVGSFNSRVEADKVRGQMLKYGYKGLVVKN